MDAMTHVLLLSDRPDTRKRWAEALASENCLADCELVERADAARWDLVVSDRADCAERLGAARRRLARGEIGMVAVGWDGPADVALPEDCSPGELQIACRLLAEIVRLRRQQREGKKVRKALSRLALSDPLTGLPNRRAWDDELDWRRRGEGSAGGLICLALIDLDHFKEVNDQRGYAAGDEALKQVARALAGDVRREDFLARLGGDEFGLLVSDVDLDTAKRVVERLRQALHNRLAEGGGPALTASAGLAVGAPGADAAKLLAVADQALRRAKDEGRGRTAARRLL